MQNIGLILALAVVVEGVVEYAKSIFNMFYKDGVKTAMLQALSIAISVLICFAANANLFTALGIVFEWDWIGVLLTGVFASRGANYVSDLIGKLEKKRGK